MTTPAQQAAARSEPLVESGEALRRLRGLEHAAETPSLRRNRHRGATPGCTAKHVAGSGGTGQPGKTENADYTFSFEDPFADASDLQAPLIQVRSGAVTGMALGPGGSRSFLGAGAGLPGYATVYVVARFCPLLLSFPVESPS